MRLAAAQEKNYNEDGNTTENKIMTGPRRIKSLWPRKHCSLYIKQLQVALNGGIRLGRLGIVRYLQRCAWIKKKRKTEFHF